jgi:hypothetical protein
MRRAELDTSEAPRTTVGTAEPIDQEHSGHHFLYLPDLSSQTRWSAHAVPTKEPERDRHPLGFRQRTR